MFLGNKMKKGTYLNRPYVWQNGSILALEKTKKWQNQSLQFLNRRHKGISHLSNVIF